MEIIWNGHSCFTVASGGYRIVLDPYRMDVYPALQLEANEVLCSHGHFDHNAAEAVTLQPRAQSPFAVESLATFHDEVQGAKRGKNTVHILAAEGFRIVHLGDLGHPLSAEQREKLQGCDVLMIPVGGYYTIDAAGAKAVADAVMPRVIVPMHYRHGAFGLREIDTVEPFLKLFPQESVHRLTTAAFSLTADTPQGVVVPAWQ